MKMIARLLFKKVTKGAYDKGTVRGLTSWELWYCYTLLPCLGVLPPFGRVLMNIVPYDIKVVYPRQES